MSEHLRMVHAACGHCPTAHGDAPMGAVCDDRCHPGNDCQPNHVVRPAGVSAPLYRPLCPTCRRRYAGAWRSHRCGTGAVA